MTQGTGPKESSLEELERYDDAFLIEWKLTRLQQP